MGMFLLLYSILATSVPLDQTHHHTHAEQEDESKDHANEPAAAGHCGLVDLVHGWEAGIGVDIL